MSQSHRRRWPWVVGAVAALLILLGVAGALYNLYWQRKVDALLASYRAKGEPVTWEEVLAARDKLPADRNSALIFQDALAEIEARDERGGRVLDSCFRADGPGARPSARTLELLRTYLEQQAPVLAIIRKSAALPSGVYPIELPENPFGMTLLYLSPLRSAVILCGREATARACAGDGAGALESLVDARRLCASIGEGWVYTEELARLAFDELIVAAAEKSIGLCQFPAEGLGRLREELVREGSELSLRHALLGERGRCIASSSARVPPTSCRCWETATGSRTCGCDRMTSYPARRAANSSSTMECLTSTFPSPISP